MATAVDAATREALLSAMPARVGSEDPESGDFVQDDRAGSYQNTRPNTQSALDNVFVGSERSVAPALHHFTLCCVTSNAFCARARNGPGILEVCPARLSPWAGVAAPFRVCSFSAELRWFW